ncbi:hypothetical protein C0991_011572 [Blastosporella zonata]|nr:hypothetical protein C0991_011572 [Blastosporella zonata]
MANAQLTCFRPREKIGRSLFIHEQFLAGSYYGKFFARNLNLYLLQRRPDEWKALPDRKRAQDALTKPIPAQKSIKRKRHTQPEDEIDAVFNASLGKRIKKAALGDVTPCTNTWKGFQKKAERRTTNLQAVLGATQSAPGHKKNRRH